MADCTYCDGLNGQHTLRDCPGIDPVQLRFQAARSEHFAAMAESPAEDPQPPTAAELLIDGFVAEFRRRAPDEYRTISAAKRSTAIVEECARALRSRLPAATPAPAASEQHAPYMLLPANAHRPWTLLRMNGQYIMEQRDCAEVFAAASEQHERAGDDFAPDLYVPMPPKSSVRYVVSPAAAPPADATLRESATRLVNEIDDKRRGKLPDSLTAAVEGVRKALATRPAAATPREQFMDALARNVEKYGVPTKEKP